MQRLEETVQFVSLLMQSAVSNVPPISDGIAGRKTGHLLNPQRHSRARSLSGCNIRNSFHLMWGCTATFKHF